MDQVLTAVETRGDEEFALPESLVRTVRDQVAALCRQHPIPDYPIGQDDPVASQSGEVAVGR